MDRGFNIRDFLDTDNMSEEEISHCEFWVTANRRVRESGKLNHEQERIQVNQQWNLDIMDERL